MSHTKVNTSTDDSVDNGISFNDSKDLRMQAIDKYKSRYYKSRYYKSRYSNSDSTKETPRSSDIVSENKLFADMLNKDILVVLDAVQLNILGQVFRPIFTGRVVEVTNGAITLDPVIIKMNTAPFYKFPTPLSFPMVNIAYFTPFDPQTRISIP